MNYKIKQSDNHTIIKITRGKLDSAITNELKLDLMNITDGGAKNIIFDLSDCLYCDSSGLGVILVANRLCKKEEGIFVLYCGLNTAIHRLIQTTKLCTVLNVVNTIEDAINIIT